VWCGFVRTHSATASAVAWLRIISARGFEKGTGDRASTVSRERHMTQIRSRRRHGSQTLAFPRHSGALQQRAPSAIDADVAGAAAFGRCSSRQTSHGWGMDEAG
jgi:hypothetical protein